VKLHPQNQPHIRTRESNQTLMADVIIALVPLYAMAAYFYGKRVLVLGAFSVAATVLIDFICTALRHQVPNIRDHSNIITGMIIPLLLPASVRYEVIFVAVLFAVAVTKHPFGGVGQNIFNPAASGVAFATVCFPRSVFFYPIPFDPLPIIIEERIRLVFSPAYTLLLGGVPHNDPLDMLLGNFPGPMGATNILVLLTCLLFLAVRKSISFLMTASYIAGFSLIAAFYPRAMVSPLQSVYYELMSGIVLICAVFLINDPVTSPKRQSVRIVYGFLAGVVCMAFRKIGRYEESVLFALLIMNAMVWSFDMVGEILIHRFRRNKFELEESKEVPEDSE